MILSPFTSYGAQRDRQQLEDEVQELEGEIEQRNKIINSLRLTISQQAGEIMELRKKVLLSEKEK